MGLLNSIGLACHTDKASDGHDYLDFYEEMIGLRFNRTDAITLIELGVGGYQFPDRGGQSIAMWEQYFPNATVWGVDLHPKNMVRNFLQASQDDAAALAKLPDAHIIIDDASHINALSIATFHIMWPKLLPGGIYIWEDIHTSYWNDPDNGDYKGDPDPSKDENTAMGYITRMQRQLHYDTLSAEFRDLEVYPTLQSVYMMRNTCVIYKKKAP